MCTEHSSDPVWEKGPLIGAGTEADVLESTEDIDKVIKIIRNEQDEEGINTTEKYSGLRPGEIILLLLHIIFPHNFPYIYQASQNTEGKRQLFLQRIRFDPQYEKVLELQKLEEDVPAFAELTKLQLEHEDWVEDNTEWQTIREFLDKYKIPFDNLNSFNIVKDIHNRPVYSDSIETMPLNDFELLVTELKEKKPDQSELIESLAQLYREITS